MPSHFLRVHHVWWDLDLVPFHQFPGNMMLQPQSFSFQEPKRCPGETQQFPSSAVALQCSREGYGDREQRRKPYNSLPLIFGQCQKVIPAD